ncbi:MAG TPA: alkaline phosphatase family protein, partial [Acidimicrobiia bacterium]|nr:alkaline phosphatase family protein [Acidimicrobiia bacterium]
MKLKAFLTAGICLTAAALGVVPASAKPPAGQQVDQGIPGKIDHLVVIYEENHSFDNLWGLWPGVNGIKNADAAHTTQVGQTDARSPLACLLQLDVNLASPPLGSDCSGGTKADGSSFNSHFKNQPFPIDDYIPAMGDKSKTCYVPTPAAPSGPGNGVLAPGGAPGGCTRDLVHRYYQEQYQIDGGRQDRYVTGSDAVGLSMGYYDTTKLPLYAYLNGKDAPNFAIEDSFFQGAFGGSFLNHQFLVAAQAPVFANADKTGGPSDLHSVVDANGVPKGYAVYKPTSTPGGVSATSPTVADNPLTQKADATGKCVVPNGAATPPAGTVCGDYAVNTFQPFGQPYMPGTADAKRLPPLTTPTIGDELSAKGVSWAWYSGGWDNAAGITTGPGWTNGTGPNCSQPTFANPPAQFPYCPDLLFQFHHQPFNYYATYQSKLDAQGHETNQERIAHLKDEADFLAAAKAGSLPAVSFVKPLGPENEHPGYTGVSQGDAHLVDLIKAIQASPDWKSTAIVITYDEFGGAWDHLSPPHDPASGTSDKWGPGTRIPAMVISPQLHKKAVVDS